MNTVSSLLYSLIIFSFTIPFLEAGMPAKSSWKITGEESSYRKMSPRRKGKSTRKISRQPQKFPRNVIDLDTKRDGSSEDKLNDILNQYDSVFVDFYMNGCPPCELFLNDLSSLASEFPKVIFVKSKCKNLQSTYRIQGNPTFIFFRDGEEVHRTSGYNRGRKSEFSTLIRKKLMSSSQK